MTATFWITGIEFVQAVQTSDNAVPLIGYKPTFVRVYVQSTEPVDIGSRLSVEASFFNPLAPTITATPQGSRRDQWGESFNFRLDGDYTAPGNRNFTATVFLAATGPENPPSSDHILSLQANFSQRIDLHVFGVVWALLDPTGSGVQVSPAAPWSDFEDHRRFVENVYPVSSFTIDPIPGIGTVPPNPQPFSNLDGSRAWATKALQNLPPGSIINMLDNWDTGGLHGLEWGLACEEQNDRDQERIGVIMSQEVAHTLGLWWHTFTQGSPYPRPDGTIGSDEIGIDITGPQPMLIVGSTPIYDIMSYHTPPPKNWVSAFTYKALFQALMSKEGKIFNIVSVSSGLVFDVPGFAKGPSPIDQYPANGGTNQQWRLVPVSTSIFNIVSVSSGLVLDVPGFAKGPVTIGQYPANGGTNQQWRLVLAGEDGVSFNIVSVSSGLVLDVPGSAKGPVAIGQYPANGGTNQQWRLTLV